MSMGSTNVGIRHGMNSSPSIYPLTLSSVGGQLLSGDSEKRWKRWNLLVLTLFFFAFCSSLFLYADLYGSSTYVGQVKTRRSSTFVSLLLLCLIFFDYSLMKKGILEKIREYTMRFSREFKEYAREHGDIVQDFS